MSWKRFAWTFAGWIVLGSILAGVLMSAGARPTLARFDATTVALSIVRTQATGIAAIALCLGLVAGTHGRDDARAPAALALIVPVSAAASAVFALLASALTLRATAAFALSDYGNALAHQVDASDPLLAFMRACLVAGVLAVTTPVLADRMNRALEWLPAKVFLAWLYAIVVVGVIELGMRAVMLHWLR